MNHIRRIAVLLAGLTATVLASAPAGVRHAGAASRRHAW